MTLAVAGLAIAAIFLSSSAGLLSRFYDRERDFRLAAESAIQIVRSRLSVDADLAVPDTGMIQLAAGLQIPDASGLPSAQVSVNVFAAATGDTTGRRIPHLTLVAVAYDAGGVRHVRRADLARESFSRYEMFVDSFPSGLVFGPGRVSGRVHANDTWRSGGSSATAGIYGDSVTAVGSLVGTATYLGDTVTGAPIVPYPRDSTYPALTTLASAANLAFAPVSGAGAGWVRGSRLEFVTADADNDGVLSDGEGFARVFDLAAGLDTSRLRVGLEPSDWYLFYWATPWDNPVVQNQCGAFYYRDGRWSFFPVSTHRAEWARPIIQRTGAANYPAVTPPTMNDLDDYDAEAVRLVLEQPTSRCFPAGSPYLMTSERMTNTSGVVTGTAADTVPFGVDPPPGGWPLSAPDGYGGNDTTFTATSRSCVFFVSNDEACNSGTHFTLGSWRAFGGTAVSGIASAVRQAAELPFLWPLGAPWNTASKGVVRATGGPLFVDGTVRGNITLVVDGDAILIGPLTQANRPGDASAALCADRVGIVAVGDVLVADNAMLRGRRVRSNALFSPIDRHLGASRDISIDANLMSLTGTVGVENPGSAPIAVIECATATGMANTSGGCLYLTGGLVMQRYSPLWSGSNTGLRWAGTPDRCQSTDRRPPYFPLTNRYTLTRTLEIEASQANNPTKIRALLMRLKGKTL